MALRRLDPERTTYLCEELVHIARIVRRCHFTVCRSEAHRSVGEAGLTFRIARIIAGGLAKRRRAFRGVAKASWAQRALGGIA